MVDLGGESRSGGLRHEAQHWHPQHPKPMRMKKGNNEFRGRERNSQTGTEYIPTRLDNSNADLGTERMEPVPRRIAEERESERESEECEGRRGGGHGTTDAGKGRQKMKGTKQAERKWRSLAVYTGRKEGQLFRHNQSINQPILGTKPPASKPNTTITSTKGEKKVRGPSEEWTCTERKQPRTTAE